MAKFKLNKVVEPFTQEDVENIYSAVFDGNVFYSCYPNNNWDDEYSIEPFKNGDKVYAGVRCSHYDYNTEEYKFRYEYVFEAGIDESKGITSVGWYSYDNTTDAYTFVEGDIEIELPMEPTEAPSDWDPELGEWVNPWITPYFYKVVTEVLPEEPDYVEPKEIEYKIKRSTLVDIANAIREKTGSTDKIKVSDLDDAVKAITAGGSDEPKQWSDLDGSIFHVVPDLQNLEGLGSYESIEDPLITSDGKHVYIRTNRSYKSYIYHLDVESGEVTLISNSEGMSQSSCGGFFEDSNGVVWIYTGGGFSDKGYSDIGLTGMVDGEIVTHISFANFTNLNSYSKLQPIFEDNKHIYYANDMDGYGVYSMDINDRTPLMITSDNVGNITNECWFKEADNSYYIVADNLYHLTNTTCSLVLDKDNTSMSGVLCGFKAVSNNMVAVSTYENSGYDNVALLSNGTCLWKQSQSRNSKAYMGSYIDVIDDGVAGYYVKHRECIYYVSYNDYNTAQINIPGANWNDKWLSEEIHMTDMYMFVVNGRVFISDCEYPSEHARVIALPTAEDINDNITKGLEVCFKLNE